MRQCTIPAPLGALTLIEEDGALVRVSWCTGGTGTPTDAERQDASSALLGEAADQITAYFEGRLTVFDVPWRVDRSPVQARACTAMAAISFGDTRSYGDLARVLGVSAQAMGQLCGANPLPIVVPCHRVLGATGLGGFSGGRGVEDKVWLLRHEGAAGLLI